MNTPEPGLLAMFDQARAEFGAELDILVQVYDGMLPGNGAGQSAANLAAFFEKQYSEVEVRALLANAVERLSEIQRGVR